jgi:hypothetical protein
MQSRERELAAQFQTELQRQMTQAEAQRHAQYVRNEILTIRVRVATSLSSTKEAAWP